MIDLEVGLMVASETIRDAKEPFNQLHVRIIMPCGSIPTNWKISSGNMTFLFQNSGDGNSDCCFNI